MGCVTGEGHNLQTMQMLLDSQYYKMGTNTHKEEIDMHNQHLDVTRKNFKMFKAGRRWVFACAVFFSVLGASAFASSETVSADTVDTPAAAVVTNSGNEATSSAASDQSTETTATSSAAPTTETASSATSDASSAPAKTAEAATVEATDTTSSSSASDLKALNDDATATPATSAASEAPSSASTTDAPADTATETTTASATTENSDVQSSEKSSDVVAETAVVESAATSETTKVDAVAAPAPAAAEAVMAPLAVAADPEGGIGGSFFANGTVTASGTAVNGLKRNADGTYTGVITLDYSGSTLGLDATTSKYVIKVPAELSPLILQADKSDITGSFTGGFLATPHPYTASDFTITQDTDGSAIITFSNPTMVTVAYAPVDITVNLNIGDMVNKSGMVIDPSDSNYSFDAAVVLPTSIIDWDVFSNWASTTTLQTNHLMPAEVSQGIQKPYVVQPVEDNDTVVSGTGVPGASVKVYNEDRMTTLGVGTVNSNGYYSVTIPLQKQGTVLNVTQTTAADGESEVTTVTVRHAPVALQQPTISPLYSGETTVSGSANNTPGTQITISDQSKNVLGYGYTDANGLYSIDINRALRAGEIISAVASNGTDQSSPAERGVLEATEVSIAAPHVNDVYDGETIVTGTGQTAGDTIIIQNAARQTIGTGTINSDRTWNVGVNTILEEGDIIYAIESDSKGNSSPDTAAAVKAQQTVTILAPTVTTPVYNNAETVHGQGHTANNTIRITDNQGNVIGTGTVGSNLNYVVALTRALNTGEIISVVETDGKNTSPETNVSVTTQETESIHAPAWNRPVYDTDKAVTGTGSTAGNVVTIKDQDGNTLGTGTVTSNLSYSVNLNRALVVGEILLATESNGTITSNASAAAVVKAVATTIKAPALDRPVYSNATTITGTGTTAGNVVTIDDQDGNTVGTATVGNDLKFTVNLNRALTEGEILFATESNGTVTSNPSAAGVVAPVATEIDAPALDHPVYTTATAVTGTGSTAGNTITIYDENADTLGTATVGNDLKFSVNLNRPLVEGEEILATESNGTVTSRPSATKVEVEVATSIHAPALNRPVYDTDKAITGTGSTAGNTISVTDDNGDVVATGIVGSDLKFTATLNRAPVVGEYFYVTESNGTATSTPSAAVVVKSTPTTIQAPTINDLTEGDTTVSGKGQTPGNTITVSASNGASIGSGTVDSNGNYSVTVNRPLAGGESISVEESNGTVTSAPASKTVAKITYVLIITEPVTEGDTTVKGEGTVEGDIVTLMDHKGAVIGTASVDRDKQWSIDLKEPAVAGENLIAQETNGQTTSGLFSTTVKTKETGSTQLAAPTVDPDSVVVNSTQVTGNGVSGSPVTVKGSDGTTLGKGTIDSEGNFSVNLDNPLTAGQTIYVTQGQGETESPAQPETVPTPTEGTLPKPTPGELSDAATSLTVTAGQNANGKVNVGNTIEVRTSAGELVGHATITDSGIVNVQLDNPASSGDIYIITETDGTHTSKPVAISVS